MFENSEQEREYQYTLLNLLTYLSKADDNVDEKEKQYVLKVAGHLGVKPNEFIQMQYDPNIQNVKIPSSEQGRMTILYYLLFLMKIDGNVSLEEENLIRKISFKLGFHHDMTEELIAIMKDHINKKLSADIMLASIRKYLN